MHSHSPQCLTRWNQARGGNPSLRGQPAGQLLLRSDEPQPGALLLRSCGAELAWPYMC